MYTERSGAGDGVHEVRGTSVLHRPERSGERTLGSIDAPLLNAKRPSTPAWSFALKERVMGIEPTYLAWKASVLPLNYTRIYCTYSFV